MCPGALVRNQPMPWFRRLRCYAQFRLRPHADGQSRALDYEIGRTEKSKGLDGSHPYRHLRPPRLSRCALCLSIRHLRTSRRFPPGQQLASCPGRALERPSAQGRLVRQTTHNTDVTRRGTE
jgi:hypothetical protein